VWDAVRATDPLLFLHMGDFHYEDIAARRRAPYRRAFSASLRAPRQARLYRSVPVAYVWDDHDFGGNSADRTSRGRRTVRLVYQEIVPHYPLAAGGGDVPIEQSFTVGRLRFVLTDLRSERTPYRGPDGPAKTLMGAAQKSWWKDELRAARDVGQLVAWVSTVPWIGGPGARGDGWGWYATERRELATFLVEQRIENLLMLSGDAHMVAIDDGSHSGYGPPGSLGFPVMHAAALDRSGSLKGGPYSEGAFPNPRRRRLNVGQFGVMKVRDKGGREVCIDWSGHRVEPVGGEVAELVRWGHCFDLGPPRLPAAR
jgi:alkaline phosphatase D